jgi:hypothetical protein
MVVTAGQSTTLRAKQVVLAVVDLRVGLVRRAQVVLELAAKATLAVRGLGHRTQTVQAAAVVVTAPLVRMPLLARQGRVVTAPRDTG